MLTYFHAKRDYLEKLFPVGERRYVSGTTALYDGMLQMVHPDRVVTRPISTSCRMVEPVYPLTEGLTLNLLRKAMEGALAKCPALPEWQDAAWLRAQRISGLRRGAPHAASPGASLRDIQPEGPAWSRLAYDELLASQLALALVRAHQRSAAGRGSSGEGQLRAKVIAALPYSLTLSQQRAVDDIVTDLARPQRMVRLLQGDVGSGKTVVALLAAATVIEAGRQAALMAPTEILARQHLDTIAPLAEAAGIRVAILTGRERGKRTQRDARPAGARRDRSPGRHPCAVPGRGRVPRSRARHRRRAAPLRRASAAGAGAQGRGRRHAGADRDADPAHAGADLFRRHGHFRTAREAGRPPADRHPHHPARAGSTKWSRPSAARSPKASASTGSVRWSRNPKRAISPPPKSALPTSSEHFGAQVDLVHGRMKGATRTRPWRALRAGETQLLVATTVIEVGVDVPEATVMVIEHAERFGLAQLHQLRGRIGRGSERSTCLLLYRAPLGETAKARLAILRETEDGFRIAEEDLRLRGEGDLLGTRQSGMPGFRVARLEVHGKLLAAGARRRRADARRAIPSSHSERGEALRHLLYLFERDEAIRLLRAG